MDVTRVEDVIWCPRTSKLLSRRLEIGFSATSDDNLFAIGDKPFRHGATEPSSAASYEGTIKVESVGSHCGVIWFVKCQRLNSENYLIAKI